MLTENLLPACSQGTVLETIMWYVGMSSRLSQMSASLIMHDRQVRMTTCAEKSCVCLCVCTYKIEGKEKEELEEFKLHGIDILKHFREKEGLSGCLCVGERWMKDLTLGLHLLINSNLLMYFATGLGILISELIL